MDERSQKFYLVCLDATELVRSSQHQTHQANGDKQRYNADNI